VGESALVEQPAAAAGVYVLLVDAGANGADVTLLNDHAAAAARSLRLVTRPVRLWFLVPPGAKDFGVVLDSPAPEENAKVTVFDPDGKPVAEGFTGAQKRVIVTTKVGAGQDGKAWSIATDKAPTGVMEDYTVSLDERLPAYWSVAPDRLVVSR
ncbi:MAG: hypothetical protein HYU66_21190, partial [Armatimonadetes bacterium]|nr:hypothetical protein [Armatimonadota bacterium]